MIKSRDINGNARVTFILDSSVGAAHAAVCGDWNDWSADTDQMEPIDGGGFTLTVPLQPGRAYRFRYLLDGERWENDWAADAYVPNDFGGDDSLVDLTALAEDVPTATSAAKQAPAKSAATKKASPAKKTTPTKKAAPAKKAAKKATKKSSE